MRQTITGYFHILWSTLGMSLRLLLSFKKQHLYGDDNFMVSFTVYVWFMFAMIYHTDILLWDVDCFLLSQWSYRKTSPCLWVISMNNDTSGWMFVHSSPKECQFKEGKVKDGLLLASSVWRVAGSDTRACWEWKTDQESNVCCGWKIYRVPVCSTGLES